VYTTEQTPAWPGRNLRQEVSLVTIVWLMTIALAVGTLGISVLTSRGWRGARHADLGWMSQQWLLEHRAGSR
jgi:hypothetical protein